MASKIASNPLRDLFPIDPAAIDRRIRARPTPLDVGALALALCMPAVMLAAQSGARLAWYFDLTNYLNASRGDFSHYYYAYWLIPLYGLFDLLPSSFAYIAWCACNIICVFLAARIFGGRAVPALLSYQLFCVLFQGQITGIIVGGLALCYWGIAHRRWHVAGLGLLVAATKYQVGVVPGVSLLLLADIAWRDRLRILMVPAVVAALSLVVYPQWPLGVLASMRSEPPADEGSIALWRWVGPAALALWLPPLLLPLARAERFAALAAANTLAIPYFQQTDLLLLFVLPLGFLALLGNLGYLIVFYGWPALQTLVVAPLAVYLPIALSGLRGFRRHT